MDSVVKVKRGAMVYIDFSSYNTRIAYETDSSLFYSDYLFKLNRYWNSVQRIDSDKKHRFYFKCLLEQSFFSYSFNSLYRFSHNDFQNWSIQFSNNFTKSSLINYQVLVKNNQSIDIFCKNTERTFNNTIYCTIMATTQDNLDVLYYQNIDLTNSSLKFESSKLINYFGYFDPNNLPNASSVTNATGDFILLNTEVMFDSKLIGFECYAQNAGQIT
ncbi:hypothetical protein BpHYR1_026949, partial [Brachionus plicatilis]